MWGILLLPSGVGWLLARAGRRVGALLAAGRGALGAGRGDGVAAVPLLQTARGELTVLPGVALQLAVLRQGTLLARVARTHASRGTFKLIRTILSI